MKIGQRSVRPAPGSLVLGVAWAGTAVWAWQRVLAEPFRALVRNVLADDAYYYFELARHFPAPEATHGVVTTGFHPLYWLLIAPLFHTLDAATAVRASMLVLVTANAATGYVVYLVARRRFPDLVAATAGAGWVVAVHVRGLVTLGLEMAIAVLAVALVVLACDRRPDSARRWILVGALTGVAFLARTDSIVVTGPVVVWSFMRRPTGTTKRTVGEVVPAVVAAGVVAVPWLAFLASQSGLAQDSTVSHRLASNLSGLPMSFVPTVFRFLGRNVASAFLPTAAGLIEWRLVLLGVGVAVTLAAARMPPAGLWLRDRAGLVAGTLLLFLLYALVLHRADLWYMLYGVFAAWMLAVPPLLALVADVARRAGLAGLVMAGAVALTLMVLSLSNDDGAFLPVQLDAYRASAVLSHELPPDTHVGSFNSGLVQFVMRQRVINLDGVVNPRANRALRTGTMCQYLHEEGIGVVIDRQDGIERLRAVAPRAMVGPPVELRDRQGLIPHVWVVPIGAGGC